MWVILGVFAFALTVVLERFIFYFIYCRMNTSNVVRRVLTAIDTKNLDQAKSIVDSRKNPFYKLLGEGLNRYIKGAAVERIMEGIEITSVRELPRIFSRINYLSLAASVATLLGLLGTITGLQTSFGSLASVDAAQKATLLANGISEAMNTTAFGLIVAVPCMILYTIFINKQHALVKDIDMGIAEFIDALKERKNGNSAV